MPEKPLFIYRSSTLLMASIAILGISTACSPPPAATVGQPLMTTAAPGSSEARLAAGPDGTIVLSWLEKHGADVALRYSTLDGDAWSTPRTVASGQSWFVNWADFPSVVPIDGDLWAAHWLEKKPGGRFSYDVAIAVSSNAGQSWSDPVAPHRDGTPTEHGFVSLFPTSGGAGALWLDGRNTDPDASHDGGHDEHAGGGMTLRSAVIGPDLTISDEQLADELVCDCCQTGVAVGPDGPVAVYRNRTRDEIRDIYVAQLGPDGWQTGKPIANDNWEIAACPVNGPSIASAGDWIGIAWFTAADDLPRVRFARSADGGSTFGPPVELASGDTIGRVGLAMFPDGTALVSWLDSAGAIKLRSVAANDVKGPQHIVARTGPGRMSGFPQIVRRGTDIVVAWTDTTENLSVVRSMIVEPVTLKAP